MASLPSPHLQLVAAPEQWISRQRFLDLAGWTLQWLSAQVRSGNVRSRETNRKLLNGRLEVEFAVSSLPAKARERYQAEQAVLVQREPQQPALFNLHPEDAPAPRIALSRRQHQEVTSKRDLLAPILDFRADRQRFRGLRLANGSPIQTQTDMVRYVAAQSGKSEATVWRALKRYDDGGEAALARKHRSDAGQSRWFALHPEAAAVAAYVGFGDGVFQGGSIAAAHRALAAHAPQLNIATADLPDYDTVRRFLLSAPADLKVLARKGEKRYGDLVMPFIERAYDDVFANQVWIADTMKADVEVQNDVFDDLPLGAPIRLQLSAIVDYRSRFFVGTCWGVVESSIPIQAAIRNAVLQHGPCEHFYCDNGKAYRKVAAGAVPGHMAAPGDDLATLFDRVREDEQRLGILGRLGVKVTHCIAHHPQSKHIERQFRTVHDQYDKLWQTYTGGAPHVRPFTTERLMSIHRKSIKHQRPEWSMHPLASDYIMGFYAWLDWHHQQPMDARGMDGRSPSDVFAQDRNPRQRATPSMADLACTFAERDSRVVDRCGIRMWEDRYVPREGDDVALSRMLALSGDANDRRRVTVLYDSHDHSSVAIADERGHLICTLVRQQLLQFAPHDEATRVQIAQGRQRSLGALRESKGKLARIRELGRAAGGRMPLELLAANAPTLPQVQPEQIAQAKPNPRKIAPKATAAPLHSYNAALAMSHLKETD